MHLMLHMVIVFLALLATVMKYAQEVCVKNRHSKWHPVCTAGEAEPPQHNIWLCQSPSEDLIMLLAFRLSYN